jgi:hypothetical protein
VAVHGGGGFGSRVTYNAWKWAGIEYENHYQVDNITMPPPIGSGLPNYGFGARLNTFSLSGIIYARPRGSRIRPYLTVGIGALDFDPTGDAINKARSAAQAPYGAFGLKSVLEPGFMFSTGFKWRVGEHLGFDLRASDFISTFPTYGLPNSPALGTVWIPNKKTTVGTSASLGINYYWGPKADWIPNPPAQPQPLAALDAGTLSVGSGTLCQGKAITVRSSGASDPAGRTLTYSWTVDGQSAGGNSTELTFTPTSSGNHSVVVTVSAANTDVSGYNSQVDAYNADLDGRKVKTEYAPRAQHANPFPPRTASSNALSLGVQAYTAPTVSSCQATPSELNYGDSAKLSATVAGSVCSTTSFQWSASEGTVADPSSAETTFDTKSVKFDQNGPAQTKTVTVNGKVTDDRGGSATCDVPIKIDYKPPVVRFDDIIFSKDSTRVNNCGKRILLEELAARAADPNFDVVLIGHYDKDEAPKTKLQKAHPIDERRVMNAYAILTGGTDKAGKATCANLDKSRIKVDWVADDQTDEKKPGLCGTSTRTATKERRSSAVSTADENRRVEVWLVPHSGASNPAGFKEAKDLSSKETARDLKKLGCPK